ncbi:GntR family transcriptional regulator [Pedobacter arcticus]|uniref:GntR family transcriptional regulator n=1 Tax=Pedobacter arcticus TaxID=752140 RepID=UPI0002E5FC83|nr:GntR family transcriptional regulator [Pedobacter arcticus]
MRDSPLFEYLIIDQKSAIPKYLQLANSLIIALEAGVIEHDYLLPSLNEVSYKIDISRETIQKSYRYLKQIGVIDSFPGKGYYFCTSEHRCKFKILVLFNKLSNPKKMIYDAFIEKLGEDALIDLHIYNNDFNLFKKLIQSHKKEYTHYVIIPHFTSGGDDVHKILNTLPTEKLILMGKNVRGIIGGYGVVFENFTEDIYRALVQARQQLKKYATIKLIFPDSGYFPIEITVGFERFCKHYGFNYEIIGCVLKNSVSIGDVFINLLEEQLPILFEHIVELGYTVGKDVGIISYNETPIKKYIFNGITTISTDFKFIGEAAANMILENSHRHIEVPFYYTKRDSI